MSSQPARSLTLAQRAAIGVLVFLLLLLIGLQTAHAGEIVPSIGFARMTGNTDTPMFYGVALRGPMAPKLKSELGVSWQHQDAENGAVTLKSMPVTFSVWSTLAPNLYFGGGTGIYYDEVSYKSGLGLPSTKDHHWAYHVGGGFNMPMSPVTALDLQGRYVFRDAKPTAIGSGKIDPSGWTAAAGVVFKY